MVSTVGAKYDRSLSPLATLGRGYAIARSTEGLALGSVDEFVPGMEFDVLVVDGAVRALTVARRSGAPLDAVTALQEGDLK